MIIKRLRRKNVLVLSKFLKEIEKEIAINVWRRSN